MILLDDARILECSDQRALLEALERGFRDPAHTPARMHVELSGSDDGKLLLMPCSAGRESIGVKIIAVMPSNRARGRPTVDGVYILMNGQTGETQAVLSAPALTALRTAGVCALAASLLSREDAKTLLMIGTGALPPHLVRAYLAVRELERVIVWGRDPAKAHELARRLSDSSVSIEVASRLPDVVGAADIICSATLAREPLIEGHRVAPGTHVDLVGSFTPDMREANTELFRRGRLVVDTETAFDESGDLTEALREGVIERTAPDLTRLLNSPTLRRDSAREITVFKTVGTGLADLAAARFILSRCAQLG